MTVDVEPGEYDLLAWCGTTDKGSFLIPETTVGKGLTCTLDRQHDTENKAFVTEDLDRLFYGWLPKQTFAETEGTYTYTVPLVKNTNNVRVVLQHLSGGLWIKTSSFLPLPTLMGAWIGTIRCCPTNR